MKKEVKINWRFFIMFNIIVGVLILIGVVFNLLNNWGFVSIFFLIIFGIVTAGGSE